MSRSLRLVTTALGIALAGAACVTPREVSPELAAYLDSASHLTDEQRQAMLAGRPFVGMTVQEANLAMTPARSTLQVGERVVAADAGNVWEGWDKVSLSDFRLTSDPFGENPTTIFDVRTSVGFGLLYHTPVGPLRLEYGLALKRATRVGVDGLRIEVDPHHLWHFSLGYAF